MAKYRIRMPIVDPPEQGEFEVEADTAEEAVFVVRAMSKAERDRYTEVASLRMEVEALRALTDCLRRQLAKYEQKTGTQPAAKEEGRDG